MPKTTAPPRTLRELLGTATLVVGSVIGTAWLGLFALATAMIAPAWNAHDWTRVAQVSFGVAAPLAVLALIWMIATMAVYGLSHARHTAGR